MVLAEKCCGRKKKKMQRKKSEKLGDHYRDIGQKDDVSWKKNNGNVWLCDSQLKQTWHASCGREVLKEQRLEWPEALLWAALRLCKGSTWAGPPPASSSC